MASLGVRLLSIPLSLLLSSLLLLLFLSADYFSFGECSLLLHSNSNSVSNDDFNANNLLEMVTEADDNDFRQGRPPPVRRPPPPVRRPPPPVRRPPPPVRRPPPPVRRPPPPVRRPPPPVRRPPPPVRRPPPPPVRRPPPPPIRPPPPPPNRPPPPPPTSSSPPPPSPDVEPPVFSDYRLGLQWAPAICSQEHAGCKTLVPDRFVIGSLQPITGRRPPVSYCDLDDKLDYHALVEELDEGPEHRLSTYWPNLFNYQDDEEHLSQEWAKYGTCSGLSQLEYFKTALDLYETIDIFTKLEEIDTHPGDRVDPSGLVSKYHDEFGVRPLISCVNRPIRPFMELLGEIQFQINKDGETVESITGETNLCRTTPVLYIKAA